MSIQQQNIVYCGNPGGPLGEWVQQNFCMILLRPRAHARTPGLSYGVAQHHTLVPNENVLLVKTETGSEYRYYRPVELRETPAEDLTWVHGLDMNEWRVLEDGTITQMPEQALEALEIVVDVTELDEGRIVGDTSNVSMIQSGTIQSMCVLERAPAVILQEAIEELEQRKFKCIKYKGFHKGGAGSQPEFTEQTKKQIFSGAKFFLFKHTVHVLNQTTLGWEPVKMLSIGIFCPQQKIDRYTGSRNTFANLRSDLKGDGLRLFDPVKFARQVRERTGALTKYYPGIAEQIVINGGKVPRKPWSLLEGVDSFPNKPTNRELLALSSRVVANNSDAGRKHQKSKDAHGRIVKQVENIGLEINRLRVEKDTSARDKRHAESNIVSWTEQIERAQATVVRCTSALANNDGLIVTQQGQLNIVQPAVEALRLQAERDNLIYRREMKELIENPPEDAPDLVERYKNTGFIVKEIRYTNRTNPRDIKSLRTDPLLPQDEGYYISYMCLMTTKPSIIYVNRGTSGENSKKVVAGPYEIEATVSGVGRNAQVRLRLANLQGVFGIQKRTLGNAYMNVRIHPHTDTRSLMPTIESLKSFVSSWTTVCLGNASSAIGKGFKDQDPRIVIMGLLAWITNANANDVWGKTHTWFPKPHEVDVEGMYGQEPEDEVDSQVTTDAGMKDTLQELANRLAQLTPNEGNV